MTGLDIQRYICCDQFEISIAASGDQVGQITAKLMGILEKVPNQVLVISCLEAEWAPFKDKAFQSFLQRVREPALKLDRLKDEQAVQLVANRLQGWAGRPGGAAGVWPFDEAALRAFVQQRRPTPRALIQLCKRKLDDWLETGRAGVIYLEDHGDGADPAGQFLRMWNAELEAIRASGLDADEYPEDRLYRAVKEALHLAREAGREVGGVRVKNVQEGAVPQGGEDKRYSLAVDLATAGGAYDVVIPVTALNNSQKFRFFFDAVHKRVGTAAGGLLVHRSADFEMGKKTVDLFDQLQGSGKIRVFALEENPATFERLECLLRFLDRAAGKELQVDGVTLGHRDCQDYLLKTAALDNLDLYRELGHWKQAPVPAPAAAKVVGVAAPAKSPPAPTMAPKTAATSPSVQPTPVAAVATLEPPVRTEQPKPPPVDGPPPSGGDSADAFRAKYEAWARQKLEQLRRKLEQWGLPVRPVGVEVGPAFARIKAQPAGAKTTFNKVRDRATELDVHLELDVAPMVGKAAGCFTFDIQLPERRTVTLDEVLAAPPAGKDDLPVFPAGVDVAGHTHWLDLSDTSDCHLLIAGQTGSGKSEFLRAMVAGLALGLDPTRLQFVLVDPKRVTFTFTGESPYLHQPVAHDPDQSLPLLEWCVAETERRYDRLAAEKKANVAELADQAFLPRYVVVIDEFANLLTEKATKPVLTSLLKQIGSMARAAGIHLVLATQRPDKDVITPLLRDNLPGRVALQVKTEASSKLILNDGGAAYLLGKGDLLWQRGGGQLRLQSPFVRPDMFEQALRAH